DTSNTTRTVAPVVGAARRASRTLTEVAGTNRTGTRPIRPPIMLHRKESGSTRSARRVFPRTAIRLSVSLFLLILLSAAPVAGQRGRTDGPPHYPTSTERLPATLPHTGVEVTRLAGTVFNDDPVLGRPGHLFIQG